MNNYILFAQRDFNTQRDVWCVQHRDTGECVFRSHSRAQAQRRVLQLQAAQ